MAQCPNCSKSIAITEDHFGTLYRCEHCKSEFFIGFDGVPENSKEAPVVEGEPAMPPVSISPEPTAIDSVNNMMAPVASEVAMLEPVATAEDSSASLFNIEPSTQGFSPPFMEPSSLPAEDVASANDLSPEGENRPQPTSNSFQEFADDVKNFGNDAAFSGVLSFDIEISGIDLGDMKRDLLEALDDKRFGWNLDELSQNIKDGLLKLENVSAPKTVVLVKRVIPIGLSVHWRHHVSVQ
ncbi:MAG: hypothetical protein JNL11_20405 [Bdellovibrionaceae bacterium]|nr:hypothetical protein [Pseudobdellovibrionaceae bacterium]